MTVNGLDHATLAFIKYCTTFIQTYQSLENRQTPQRQISPCSGLSFRRLSLALGDPTLLQQNVFIVISFRVYQPLVVQYTCVRL